MVFSSVTFVFGFLALTLAGCYLFAPDRRNVWLLLMSVFFYAWGEPIFVVFILISIVINYGMGLVTASQDGAFCRKLSLTAAILFNLGVLVYFKYSAFFASVLSEATGLDLSGTVLVSSVPMPIGISFFTFQILSYQIDVFRRNVPVQKNILKLALYIMLFPQMIAGPIVRYLDVAAEIDHRSISLDDVYQGSLRFLLGLSKKVLFANQMAAIADYAYAHIGQSGALSWLGAICYMLQIYYDFSGYSDMAIGMGRMLGFHFLENFNRPYIAQSVQDFWRRWHISLSSWFRDYLYIPLGGNRRGKGRTYFNLLIVFFVTGLWHGASYNFIVWGLFHGAFLCLERLGMGKALKKLPKVIRHGYTLFVVLIGWILFRADTLSDALRVVATMFDFSRWNASATLHILTTEHIVFLLCAILLIVLPYDRIKAHIAKKVQNMIYPAGILLVSLLAVLYMIGSDFNPFIYFRF